MSPNGPTAADQRHGPSPTRSRRALVATSALVALAALGLSAVLVDATGFLDPDDVKVETVGGAGSTAAAPNGSASSPLDGTDVVPGGVLPLAAPASISASWPVATPGSTGPGGSSAVAPVVDGVGGAGDGGGAGAGPVSEPLPGSPTTPVGPETVDPGVGSTSTTEAPSVINTTTTVAPARSGCEPAGFHLTVCIDGSTLRAVVASGSPLTCKKATGSEIKCGKEDTASEMELKLSGGTIKIEHFPAAVGCVPGVGRFDCVQLAGQGEAVARPASAFIELWAKSKSSVGVGYAPTGCSPSKEFTCNGVAFETDGEDGYYALKVAYTLAAQVECAAYPDVTRDVVVIRCGGR